jgi:outer membrane autotransporter protein
MKVPKSTCVRLAVRRGLWACGLLAPACFMTPAAWGQAVTVSVDAGSDQTVLDTDALPGESVALTGAASAFSVDPASGLPVPQPITAYVWTNEQGTLLGTAQTINVRLPDGTHEIALRAQGGPCNGESPCGFNTDVVIVTVRPTTAPIANAGADRTIPDSNNAPGETVTLDASGSSDPDGTIVSYEWLRNGTTPLGTGQALQTNLPDGVNDITLIVRDNVGNTATDAVRVTLGSAAQPPVQAAPVLAENPELTQNELSVAIALDDLCPRLEGLNSQQPLTGDELDLFNRCSGLLESAPADQKTALAELGAQELNAIRAQAILFSRTQYQGVMDRLLALRAGQRGISVAGLQLSIGGNIISAEQVAKSLQQLIGGGASADEHGDLLGSRFGLWMRGNVGTGDKSASAADSGFESEQWGLTGGVDYRLGASAVLGVSFGYGKSDLEFSPVGEGTLDVASIAGSIYGSAYRGNFYVDGVFNYVASDYDSARHIAYDEPAGRVDRTGDGATEGDALSGGLSVGYDFLFGGLTVSPTIGYFYVDTNIDSFIETGAGGVSLAYDEQHYESATGNAGFRASYAWKLPWGVLVPHLRASYVREFEDATEVFGVRFAADPFADSADPTPPIIVRTDEPDESYYRLAAGMSAQFKHDISGYFEYQRLESYQYVSFEDYTIGLRFQHSFR